MRRAPSDREKAQHYIRRLRQMDALGDRTVGAFVFRLGDPKPDDLHWWNLTLGDAPRAAFLAIAHYYAGVTQPTAPTCPNYHFPHPLPAQSPLRLAAFDGPKNAIRGINF